MCLALLGTVPAAANNVEWDSVNGGGGKSTGLIITNVLKSSMNQLTASNKIEYTTTRDERQGYRIGIPMVPVVTCTNGGSGCSTSTCYDASEDTFTFTATFGWDDGASHYFRYLWQGTYSYTNSDIHKGGTNQKTWGTISTLCPGGSCDKSSNPMTLDADTSEGTWYLILRSYNGGQNTGDGLIAASDTILGPYNFDGNPPVITGTVTPSDVYYSGGGGFVDDSFDLDVSGVSDPNDSPACSGIDSCEYCLSTDGACDSAGEWHAANYAAGACEADEISCTDGDSLTLNMRATDNVGQTTTATPITSTCDGAAPGEGNNTANQILPTTDQYSGPDITSGDLTCYENSAGSSGLQTNAYDVEYCDDGTSKGDCGAAGLWKDEDPPDWSSTNNETITGSAGHWYRFRGRCIDNVGNTSGWTYSTGYYFVDNEAPDNPASVTGYDSSSKNVTLTSGNTYDYDNSTPGPYFEWDTPDDNPVGLGSGVAGYYVYFGTNNSADPFSYQADAPTNSYTNSSPLTAGKTYYLRIKTNDVAGNVSSAVTLFTYKFSNGAYVHVTEIDNDGTDYGGDLGSVDGATDDSSSTKLDGVLNPNDSDIEIVVISLYDEWDNLASNGGLADKSVTVTLNNVGSTGAYISSTSLGGATPGGTSVTGTLSSGTGWIKVKADGTEQESAIYVTATVSGTSQTGGHDQRAYILVRDPTGSTFGTETVLEDEFSPANGGTVMLPVWNHAGDAVVVAARSLFYPNWNLYKLTWGGSSWGSGVRLTNDNMCVQPFSRTTFSGDDSYVIFSARPDCSTSSEVEMFAVAADGTDKSATLNDLTTAQQKISDGTGYYWYDVQWNRPNCSNETYKDRMLVSLMDLQYSGGLEIYMLYGSKNANGLYTEQTSNTPEQVTMFGGNEYISFQGSWSYDCTKITFTTWQYRAVKGDPPSTGIYVIDLTKASLPITSLSDTGVTAVQECTNSSCPNGAALYPSFTKDGTMISYMTEANRGFWMKNLIKNGSTPNADLTSNFFTGVNFDNYLEYIGDQPTFAPQLIGESTNNEFGLVQCFGDSCPNSDNGNMFTYITQKTGSRDGKLAFLELGNVSTITSNGGLMFYQGAVAAVIPPGALSAKTELTVSSSAPSGDPGGDEDILVSVGEARDFYPDGVKFSEDILLVFQYCDSDNDGYLDTNQDATCTGGGNSTIDENDLYVYYWCDDGTSLGCETDTWEQLNGSIDQENNQIKVAINHFSKYDMLALVNGRYAPQNFVQLNLQGLHTFPNPWRTGDGMTTFFANDNSTYNTGGTITVNIEIFDIRGKIVRNLMAVHGGTIPPSIENAAAGGLALAQWDARNNAGRAVASGIYPYVLRINDGVFSKTYTGKLSIVR